jgi:hypothetical protein
MSPTRRSWAVLVGSVAALTLLSGCFGSNSQAPTATHRTRHHSKGTEPTAPTATTTSPPSSPTSLAVPASLLRFSPRSGGKHLDDCQRLQPGDDPAEFLYYPVVVTAHSAVTLEGVDVEFTGGVVTAGSWIAPAAPTQETGTFKGWPPTYVAHDSNLRWSQRMPAKGATLAAGVPYNVFLRLQVDPTPGDSQTKGLEFHYRDSDGDRTDTWVAKTTFSMSC